MNFLQPTREQMKKISSMEDDGPLVFVNLLKFKPDGGAESFKRYEQEFNQLMEPKGVKSLYQGKCLMSLIGTEEWDEIVIVVYPTLSTWKNMTQDKDYLKIAHHRTDAVADARLIITEQIHSA